ncbi:hypothetical protein [Sedimenticola sp.]|uniref:hypothetical protein n=1 Tax=Sedimenticola sp. TaxID=1940285 RepID=UPI003D0DA6D8
MWLRLCLLGLCLLISGQSMADSEMAIRAPRLHDLYCKSCHTATRYLLDDRKIHTQAMLRRHVAGYRGKVAPVSEAEIIGIADYLWESYYKDAPGAE